MDDIYTGRSIVTPSDEHVLLNALGGRLVGRDLIDKTTNDKFGDSIDAALANDLLPLRVLLNVRSGDGTPPPKLRGAVGPDGATYNLLPGGEPEMGKPSVRFSERDGMTYAEASARSLKELKSLLGRSLEKAGVPVATLEESIRTTLTPAPRMKTDLSVGEDGLRAVAKMAANLLALSSRDVFDESGFDALRSYVLRGDGASNLIRFNTRPVDILSNGQAMGALDHLIVVRRHTNGDVCALVAIYSHMQWLVRLGNSKRPVARRSYRIDQLRGVGRRDSPLDARVRVPMFSRFAGDSRGRVFHEQEVAMRRLMTKVMKIQKENFERRIIRQAMQEVIGDWSKLTHDNVRAVSRAIGERYVKYAVDFGLLKPELQPDWGLRIKS
ncbi:MAG: hypothetical protein KF850_19985 [Labilithrix sp.]|nr:hypothetical protein [Labilithrix sp.]